MSLISLEISNFKRFPSIRLPLNKSALVICGPNGSGKTQLLWAALLFFRAHNLHYLESSRYHPNLTLNDQNVPFLDLRVEARFLLHPSFLEPRSMAHFIHRAEKGGEATFTCLREEAPPLTMTLRANGYAFMGPDFHFSDANEGPVDPVTSNHPHIRNCAAFLHSKHPEAWRDLCGWVKDLFSSVSDIIISGDTFTGLWLHVIERSELEDDIKLEIIAMGAAFQKIFAAFVLLSLLLPPRTLDPAKNTQEAVLGRYFLLEEPEAFLYPSLVARFCERLRKVCWDHNVRLLIVSNSPAVIDTTTDRLVLSGRIAGTLADEAGLAELGLGGTHKAIFDPDFTGRLIVHEGRDDAIFLRHVAPLFGFAVDDPQVRFISATGSGNLQRPEFQILLNFLQKQYPRAVVRVLKDHDFDSHKTHSHDNPALPIVWDLPSIESYVFLYYCLGQKALGGNPLAFLRDLTTYTKFIVEYIKGLGANKQGQEAVTAATRSIEKDAPTIDDFITVSKILHGHTWVRHQAAVEGLKGTDSVNGETLLKKYITRESLKENGPDYPGHHLATIVQNLFSD